MKKNIIVLLLIPFLIAILSVVTVNVSISLIAPEIVAIDWDYDDHEGFQLSTLSYKLNATARTKDPSIVVTEGNQLIFSVKNKNEEDKTPLAEVKYEGGYYYLKTLGLGDVIVTCKAKNTSLSKSMTATIFKDGAILINPSIKGSGQNVDSSIYYGNYDFNYNNNYVEKVDAKINFKFNTLPNSISNNLYIKEYSNKTISDINLETGVVSLKHNVSGESFITLGIKDQPEVKETTYKFNVVKDGINVYSYKDLLNCSNNSKDGEVIVLRKSFESNSNALENDDKTLKHNNVDLFGNYDSKKKKFNFINEIYTFDTTFNDEYIKQWNNFASENSSYKEVSNKIKAGLRVQKDVYGNGYTINMHNLCYPSEKTQTNEGITLPHLGKDDLFRGPLPYYALGDPNGMPLVKAFGQDNVGMYVDGNNITINDLNLKNCDFDNSLSNLEFCGTVLENNGSNNIIKNSKISNGKNVIRAFNNDNLVIDNCLIQNAYNFLVSIGRNEYEKVDLTKLYPLLDDKYSEITLNLEKYLSKDGSGDKLLTEYLFKDYTVEEKIKITESLDLLQKALNNVSDVKATNVTINDCLFYRSGIASISLDSLFNGPFLSLPSPSKIVEMLGMITDDESKPIVPFVPTMVGGVSYPVNVSVRGNTKFYDYKDIKNMDIKGLITENISTILKGMSGDLGDILGGKVPDINIDKIFPIKSLLEGCAGNKYSIIRKVDDKDVKFVNIPFAFYGGGLNNSSIDLSNLDKKELFSDKMEVDLISSYLDLHGDSMGAILKRGMLRIVTTVTGFESFHFVLLDNSGYLYGEVPNILDLKNNFKED